MPSPNHEHNASLSCAIILKLEVLILHMSGTCSFSQNFAPTMVVSKFVTNLGCYCELHKNPNQLCFFSTTSSQCDLLGHISFSQSLKIVGILSLSLSRIISLHFTETKCRGCVLCSIFCEMKCIIL